MINVTDVEMTPNPHALKFFVNKKLLQHESRQFPTPESAVNDPLAKGIFDLGGVVSVFYMDRFITIEKERDIDWGKIQRPFAMFLSRFDDSFIPAENEQLQPQETDGALFNRINALLDQKVKPILAADGGGLEVLGLNGKILTVRYQGACGSCPSAISGTLRAINNLVKREIDPTIEVIQG